MILLEVYSGSFSNVVTLVVVGEIKPRYHIKSFIIGKEKNNIRGVFTIRKTRKKC